MKFSKWARGEDEASHKDFPVGSLHPCHYGPVCNMSDPVHLAKKVVNALWFSDIPGKQRSLGMFRMSPLTGVREFSQFSLKTLERAYKTVEDDGVEMTPEERVSTLQMFLSLSPAMFKRNSHTCMNVSLSAKVSTLVYHAITLIDS